MSTIRLGNGSKNKSSVRKSSTVRNSKNSKKADCGCR